MSSTAQPSAAAQPTTSLSPHHKRSFSTRNSVSSRISAYRAANAAANYPHVASAGTCALPLPNLHSRRSQHHSPSIGSSSGIISGSGGGGGSLRSTTQNLTGAPHSMATMTTMNHNVNSGGSNIGSSATAPALSPRHHSKASYFFPELTQGCLFFRDFVPVQVEKGGTFSSPQFEPFSKLVEHANQWISSCDASLQIQIIKAECIQIRAAHNTGGQIDTRVSFHPEYVDWGMYLTGLRLWCRQTQDQSPVSDTPASASQSNERLDELSAGIGQKINNSKTPSPNPMTKAGGIHTSPLLSSRCMSLDVDSYQPGMGAGGGAAAKHIYLSPNESSPRLSPMSGDDSSSAGNTTTATISTTTDNRAQRISPRPPSSTSSRASSDPITPPVFTGRLAYLDVLPDLLHAGVRTIEYERLSALVGRLNQKILDKRACNILTVQTVALRLHTNDTPDTECTCFSLHGHKQKCRLVFLRVFYFVPRLNGNSPPSRSSPRDSKHHPTTPGEAGPPRSPTEIYSSTNSASSSRRSSLSRDAHQHQRLLSQLEQHHKHGGGLPGSSPGSRRGSLAYKEEIGLADFVPQIVRTNMYGKQGIEGMTSLARRAGEWFKRYREEHPDIRLINFQTVNNYVRDWKNVDTEKTFFMVQGDSDTFQYQHRALRVFYSRYVECVPYLPPFPLIDLKAFAPRQLNTPAEFADTRFESTVQTASQIDQWLCDSASAKKLMDIETYDVTYCGIQDTVKAIEVPYLYSENREKYVLTTFFLYYTDEETGAARKEPMELSPWHANGSTASVGGGGGSRRHSIAAINLRNKVAREDENPDGCSIM